MQKINDEQNIRILNKDGISSSALPSCIGALGKNKNQ